MNEFEQPQEGSEKRLIPFILVTLAAYWIWATWFMPKHQPAKTEVAPPSRATEIAAPVEAPPAEVRASEAPTDQPYQATSTQPEQVSPLETKHWKGEWTNRSGAIRSLQLVEFQGTTQVTPIYQWVFEAAKGLLKGEKPERWVPYESEGLPESVLSSGGKLAIAGGMDAVSDLNGIQDADYEVVSAGARSIEFRRVTADGLEVVKRYELNEDSFLGNLSVSWRNVGSRVLSGDLWVGLEDEETLANNRYSNDRRPQAYVGGSLLSVTDTAKLASKPIREDGSVSWFGEGNRYFLTALIPVDSSWGSVHVVGSGPRVRALQVAEGISLEPGASKRAEFKIYAGPKRLPILKAMGADLEKSVQFGWFGFFSRILLWLLQKFNRVVNNWGVAIILLTVFVKAVFFPLTQKSYRSSKEMQKIQPKLAELKEKYKDKPDLLNQETMKVMQEHKVNPLGGCLPTLVQLPVWMALYSVLLYSVDLYHSQFLFYHDLSAPDPYAILPILVGVLMFVQQRLTPMTGVDPTQAKMMQFMPLIFCFFTFSFPSGLGLYIFVNSVLSIAQQKFIDWSYRKTLKADA